MGATDDSDFRGRLARLVAVLLEDNGCEERSFEAVCAAVPDDPPKAPQRGPAVWLLVVRQAIEIALDVERRSQPGDQPSLARRQRANQHQPSRVCRRALDPDSTRSRCKSEPDCLADR